MADEEPRSILVKSAQGEYPVYIGYNLLSKKSFFSPYVNEKQVFILSHLEIAGHYLDQLIDTCQQAGAHRISHLFVPSGDHHKTLDTANHIWSILLSTFHHRDTTIIALGGGMIGDLAGFCAACYLRGIDVIQIPTSFLAQIDSSIGGKTAVNHSLGKNMIGAFKTPRAVIIDLQVLQTLPHRELNAGMAELIKYGITLDASFFHWLERHHADILKLNPEALMYSVMKACRLKADIVATDETEKGIRRILNFGHTIAHALESLLDYQCLLHGEAVSIGMVVATHLSLLAKRTSVDVLDRLISILSKINLPTKLPLGVRNVEILSKIKHDKKHSRSKLQWVLLDGLGKTYLCEEVTDQKINAALAFTQ